MHVRVVEARRHRGALCVDDLRGRAGQVARISSVVPTFRIEPPFTATACAIVRASSATCTRPLMITRSAESAGGAGCDGALPPQPAVSRQTQRRRDVRIVIT